MLLLDGGEGLELELNLICILIFSGALSIDTITSLLILLSALTAILLLND